jgi:hypothetical protein
MRNEFTFRERQFVLEVAGTAEPDGDFMKCSGTVSFDGASHQGNFKLTQAAWQAVNRKAKELGRPLDASLAEGCAEALRAELFIRLIPEGFSYVVDHRFFDKPPGY